LVAYRTDLREGKEGYTSAKAAAQAGVSHEMEQKMKPIFEITPDGKKG
jgi:hypothetical protein